MWSFLLIPSAKEVFNKPFLCIPGALILCPIYWQGVQPHHCLQNIVITQKMLCTHRQSPPLPVRSPWSFCLHGFAYFGHGAWMGLHRALCSAPSASIMLLLSPVLQPRAELHAVYSWVTHRCMETGFYSSIYQVMDVIINRVVMNVYIQVFVWTQCILSPGCIPSNGMPGSYGNYLINWETARLFSRAAPPFYHQQPPVIHVNCVFFWL